MHALFLLPCIYAFDVLMVQDARKIVSPFAIQCVYGSVLLWPISLSIPKAPIDVNEQQFFLWFGVLCEFPLKFHSY